MKYLKEIIILSTAALLLSACGGRGTATYVESGGAESLRSTRKINIADWKYASATLVNDLLNSGAIEGTGLPMPIKMDISVIKNDTTEVIDTSMISNQVSVALNASGKVHTISSDPLTKDLAAREAFMRGTTIAQPKFTLTGKISDDDERIGRTKEITYIFTLELNYLSRSIWQGRTEISKQSTRPMIGF